MRHGLGSVLMVALGAAAFAPGASAETTDCRRISRLPAVIAEPGVFCLDRDLSSAAATGAAISIDADDVVLDLNGWTLDGSAAGAATEARGIESRARSNVTVRNGTVRGFFSGILLGEAASGANHGNRVEDIRAVRNTAHGITASGRGTRVTRNQVIDTGGSTSPLGPRGHGIVVNAPGGLVSDNVVTGTRSSTTAGFSYGIHATRSNGLVIENNVVSDQLVPGVYGFGIIIPFSDDVLAVGNRITRTDEGITYSSFATGKYRDNITAGVALPYSGTGTDAGNNQ